MKRMGWILVAVALTLSTTGCGHKLFKRGARCRPGVGSSAMSGLHGLFKGHLGGGAAGAPAGGPPADGAPGCNSGCNGPEGAMSSGFAPSPYSSGPVQSGEVIVNEYTTGPVETTGPIGSEMTGPVESGTVEGPVQANRPFVSGAAGESSRSGHTSDVPGPETGPLPNN